MGLCASWARSPAERHATSSPRAFRSGILASKKSYSSGSSATSRAVELTQANTRLTRAVALNDGGRADSVATVRALAAAEVDSEAIDEQTISNKLRTSAMPDPDLLIHASGEYRRHNFPI